MPGIVGIISRGKPPGECRAMVERMRTSMLHESFYVSGLHDAPELGIYAGWVSHPGSFAAIQNRSSSNGSVSLIFSGECFRPDASASPIESGPGSTDWLIHTYLEQGEKFIVSLNGLFSGLLIDHRRKQALLFNDRYGIERLYFHEADDAWYFASEAKALLRVLPELRAFDDLGVAQFLAYGCTLEWQTLFKGISLAPGGTQWVIGPGKELKKLRYFSPEQWESQTPLTEAEYDEAFGATFAQILPRYTQGEQKLGLSLTGGLDSRMVIACLPALAKKPVCYTFTAGHPRFLDARIAAKVAGICGFEHQEIAIGADFLKRFPEQLDRTVYVTDGSAGALGAHEIYLNTTARTLAPTRLTGNFGSEVLRAVSTFKPRHLAPELLVPEWDERVGAIARQPPNQSTHPVSFSAFREVPWALFGTLAASRSQVTFRTPYLDNDLVALAYRVPLEFRTSPLPAIHLVQRHNAALAAIPTDRGLAGESRGAAFLLRRLYANVTFKLDYLHKEGLPSSLAPLAPLLDAFDHTGLLGQHKFLAYRRWFSSELAGFLRTALREAEITQAPFWNMKFMDKLAEQHIGGSKNYLGEINAILSLAAIKRLLFRDS